MLTLAETAADSVHTSRACVPLSRPTTAAAATKSGGVCIRFDECQLCLARGAASTPELRDCKYAAKYSTATAQQWTLAGASLAS